MNKEKKLAEELDHWEKTLDLREQNLAVKLNLREKNMDCRGGQMSLSQPKYIWEHDALPPSE